MARQPEDTDQILKPIGNWTRLRDISGDRLWAGSKGRTSQWAVLSILLWLALGALYRVGVGSLAWAVLATALLFPALMFAWLVPPRGHSLLRGFNIGVGATVLLMLLLLLLNLLARGTYAGRALSRLWD
jgi:hypothetical protein